MRAHIPGEPNMAVFRLSLSLSSVVPDPCKENMLNRSLCIWILSVPKLFAGSGKKHSGSGQAGSVVDLKQNLSVKIHYFSTKCTGKFSQENFPKNL
jgi:hypothetical protein